LLGEEEGTRSHIRVPLDIVLGNGELLMGGRREATIQLFQTPHKKLHSAFPYGARASNYDLLEPKPSNDGDIGSLHPVEMGCSSHLPWLEEKALVWRRLPNYTCWLMPR
jgi:hypothetical protein